MRLSYLTATLAILCCSCSQQPQPTPVAEKKAPADPPKVLMFYSSPPSVARGQAANLCYGTENVTSVLLDPPVETLKPALSRCFEVTPKATTTYKLTVQGPGGQAEKSLTVKVGGSAAPAAKVSETALILFFVTATPELPKGTPATLCYGVKDANTVRMEPEGPALKPATRNCFTVQPEKTTKYTLVAVGPSGTDRQDLTITIK